MYMRGSRFRVQNLPRKRIHDLRAIRGGEIVRGILREVVCNCRAAAEVGEGGFSLSGVVVRRGDGGERERERVPVVGEVKVFVAGVDADYVVERGRVLEKADGIFDQGARPEAA